MEFIQVPDHPNLGHQTQAVMTNVLA